MEQATICQDERIDRNQLYLTIYLLVAGFFFRLVGTPVQFVSRYKNSS